MALPPNPLELTVTYNFNLPTVGGDLDTWGALLNQNWELADTMFKTLNDGQDARPTVNEMFDKVYPVGSIYITTANVDPSTLFEGTTWAAIAQGRALVGVGTADGMAWSRKQTRGEAGVKLTTSEMPSHNHSANPPPKTFTSGGNSRGHTHSVDPSSATTSSDSHNHGVSGNTGYDGRHNHEYYRTLGGSGSDQTALGGESRSDFPRFYDSKGDQFFISGSGDINETLYTDGARNIDDGSSHRHSFSATTDTDSHSHTINLPAKTSSGESQNHTHSVTVDLGSFNTGSAGSNGSHNNVQPSIGVYMWERTA